MKQEKLKELLNELIERDFTIEEVCVLFDEVESYLSEKKESERVEEDEDYRKFHAMNVPICRKWLQERLDAFGLNYTIEDFEA